MLNLALLQLPIQKQAIQDKLKITIITVAITSKNPPLEGKTEFEQRSPDFDRRTFRMTHPAP